MPKESGAKPVITKRRVTCRSAHLDPISGDVKLVETKDYVLPEVLADPKFLATLRGNWQYVEVSEEPDAGPGGYHGATYIPDFVDHPEAGTMRAATMPKDQR